MKTWLNNLTIRVKSWVTGNVIECDSSAIDWFRYTRSRHTLTVRFTSGAVYEYGGITPKLYLQLLRSGSKGRFFSRQIRDAHPYRRVPAQ